MNPGQTTRPRTSITRRAGASGGSPSALRASFALGCDGASSFVRRALGIDWLSLGYDQDWLVVDIVQGPEADLPTGAHKPVS